MEAILRCALLVLKHVPKGARGSFAGVLASCLRALLQCGTWDNLEALLLLPKFVLRVPASSRGGAKRRNSTTDFVRRRCEDFSSKEFACFAVPVISHLRPRIGFVPRDWCLCGRRTVA